MALSNGSSQTLGLLDVISAWEAFEVINKCTVTCMLEARRTRAGWELWMSGSAWIGDVNTPEAQPLVSESVKCSAMEWKSLDTVAFRLLYALDGALASLELGKDKKR